MLLSFARLAASAVVMNGAFVEPAGGRSDEWLGGNIAFVTTSSLTLGMAAGSGGTGLATRGADSDDTDVLRLLRQSVRIDLTGLRLAPCCGLGAASVGAALLAGENWSSESKLKRLLSLRGPSREPMESVYPCTRVAPSETLPAVLLRTLLSLVRPGIGGTGSEGKRPKGSGDKGMTGELSEPSERRKDAGMMSGYRGSWPSSCARRRAALSALSGVGPSPPPKDAL